MDELRRRAQLLVDDPPLVPTTIDVLRQRARRRRSGRRALAAATAVIVGIAVTGIAVRSNGGGSHRRVVVAAGGLELPIAQTPSFVAIGADAVWVVTTTIEGADYPGEAGTLLRVDPATNAVVAVIALTGAPTDVAVDQSYAWVTLFRASAVAKIDLATNQVAATIPLVLPKPACSNNCPGAYEFLPVNVVAGDGAVWVSTARGYVARIDPTTDRVVAMIATEFDQTASMAVTPTAVLVSQGNQPIARIDPQTNTVSKIANPVNGDHGFARAGAVGELFSSTAHPELGVWATASLGGPESAGAIGIDPITGGGITANIGTGVQVRGVTDRVWVQSDHAMSAISVTGGGVQTDPRIPIPDRATVALDDTSAWWILPGSNELTRTDLGGARPPLRIQIIGP